MSVHEDITYIRLDAFNLWPGAVIAEQDSWDITGSLQVVTQVIRNHDTESVVLFYRDLDYAGMAVSAAPGVAPRTSVIIIDFNETFRVYGNVVNPDKFDDSNHGQSRNPDGQLYVEPLMPSIVQHFDPYLKVDPVDYLCEDFGAAIDCALEAEDWIHQTSDRYDDDGELVTPCVTILMWDEGTSTFYLYVDLTPVVVPVSGGDEHPIQIDTFVYSERA